ncbi:MAG: type IV secretion system DNA-binding domain-containing protein [Actinobacteria bacterium]|nr:type IV secretion system DNA-binding domain-containing protein [Actinomycetota bacterium]
MTCKPATDDIVGFYLPEEDRSTHVYVLGSSGVGKSKGLATWILGDIMNGNGCGVIDPHGDLVNDIVGNLKDFRNVTLVEMTDPDNIIGFNPLEQQEGIDPYTQTLELIEVFRKIWNLSDDKTPRLIEILRNAVLTLIEAGGTMLDIEPLLTNEQFRKEKMKYVTYEAVDSFWHNRYEKWDEKERINNIESTLNKVSSFTSDPRIRLMLSAKKSTIDFRQIMDEEKVVLINLAKGVLRTNSFLLGALFVAKIQMAAMSRVDLPPSERKPFYLYVDEFQNYATLSFAEIMSEARKYGLSLVLAHQSLVQLDHQLRDIILGNAKNFVIYRCDRQDAELIVKYVKDYDPFDWKIRNESSYTYFTKDEQREAGISDLIGLPTQVAILKTKGKEEMMFRTFDLDESWRLEESLTMLRRFSKESGKTIDLAELDEDITFPSSFAADSDEPYSFLD